MSDHTIEPRMVAVVTGSGGGLGSRVALSLARAGLGIACVDIDGDAAKRTVDSIVSEGFTALPFALDITDSDAVDLLALEVRRNLGQVSHLLNLAGILLRADIKSTDGEAWRRVLDVNLTAPFLLTRAFADDLRSAPYGRVVNCASVAATAGYPQSAYGASKAGLVSLTKSSLFEFWNSRVTVNAVAPGAMPTPMVDAASFPAMNAKTPSGQIVSVEQVSAAIEFLASEAAGGVNGVTLTVDGGATAVFSYALP